MEFKDMVGVTKGAISAGVKREAEILIDTGSGPMLQVEGIKAILQTQQLIIVAGRPPRKPKRSRILPGQRSMLDIWDKVKV